MELKDIDSQNVNQISKVVAYFVFAAMGALALRTFVDIADSVKKMEANISQLNQKMAIVLTETGGLKEKSKDHELRLRNLESKKK